MARSGKTCRRRALQSLNGGPVVIRQDTQEGVWDSKADPRPEGERDGSQATCLGLGPLRNWNGMVHLKIN